MNKNDSSRVALIIGATGSFGGHAAQALRQYTSMPQDWRCG